MIGVGSRAASDLIAFEDPRREGRALAAPWRGWAGLDLAPLDPERERRYWVALSLVPGVGPVAFGRLLLRYGSAERAWQAGSDLLQVPDRMPPDAGAALARLRREGAATAMARIQRAVAAAGGGVVTALDAGYPPALRVADPRPAVLYVRGEQEAFFGPAVAVVGTRRASGYGRSSTVQIADALARAGVAVVSGLALGIDAEAHGAALEAGGRSIAVLPSPLDRIYPPRHRGLAERLVDAGGALVSELPPGQLPERPDFARRNRIIAGLASATVVVEAPDRSGALLTAAAAVDLGRDVYAVPGPMDAATSRGCNRLVADHIASLVTSPAALLASLGLPAAGADSIGVGALSDPEGMVLARLLGRPASVDELLGPTRLSPGTLAGALTLLEARGLVTSYGGATYHPTLMARRMGRPR